MATWRSKPITSVPWGLARGKAGLRTSGHIAQSPSHSLSHPLKGMASQQLQLAPIASFRNNPHFRPILGLLPWGSITYKVSTNHHIKPTDVERPPCQKSCQSCCQSAFLTSFDSVLTELSKAVKSCQSLSKQHFDRF